MNARAWVLSASLLLGCLPAAEPYRCDLAGGDRACDSVPGARCVSGYCAESVSISLCASGLRYTATARRPGECAAGGDAATPDASDAVTDASAFDAGDVAVDVAASLDVISAIDAPEVSPLADRPTSMDLVVADLPTLADAVDANDVSVPPARDVPDLFDVAGPPFPLEWISPLPNERFLAARVSVRVDRRGGSPLINVRIAQGLRCEGPQRVVRLFANSTDIPVDRDHHCLRLEVGEDGGVWTSPWRHIVSMGRTYADNATPDWGRWPDFNNDGFADLLMATATAVRVFHFQNGVPIQSDAAVPGPTRSALPVAVAAVGDVDGDSFGDAVITWNMNPGREVYVHRGGPRGLQGPSLRILAPDGTANADPTLGDRIYAIGDRGGNHGDGRADFGVLANNRGAVRIFGVSPEGRLVEGNPYRANTRIDAFVSDADVDGDGQPDAAFTDGGVTYLSLSRQTNNITLPVSVPNGVAFAPSLALGSDLDNDGRSELAVFVPGLSQAVLYQWVNGELRELARVMLSLAPPAQLVMPGDVSNDANDDLYAFTGASRVQLRLGGTNRDAAGVIPWTAPLGVILAGVAEGDTRARVWGPGSTAAPDGFLVYAFNDITTFATVTMDSQAGPVIAVSP